MATLTVEGKLESLDDIRAFITEQASAAGIDDRRVYKLCLAIDEIATNIVNYGYSAMEDEGTIEITVDDQENQLEVVLEDESPAFNPFSRKSPDDLDAPLEERSIGGLGIFLATENVDEFSYEFKDGRNYNKFVVNKETATPQTN